MSGAAAPLVERLMVGRGRILLSALLGFAIGSLLPAQAEPATRILIGWNSAALCYLLIVAVVMARSDIGDIRRRAAENDENRWVIPALLVGSALASLGALIAEMANSNGPHWLATGERVALAACTVVLSWTVTHIVFTLHYAHLYYGEGGDGDRGGLDIPGGQEPTFADFLYFAFVIGCASATADINITTREMRRVAAIHGIVSFAFNTAIVALSINIGASLL